jgi:serine/threonine-protein kinase RsbW/stage II sporulation protein AB (anti-sigma F factor)
VGAVSIALTDTPAPDGQRLFQTTEPFAGGYASVLGSVHIMRGEITAIATRRGLTGDALADVTLAISEAATNAVVHGSRLPDAQVRMTVGFERGSMQVVVSDEGHGMGGSPKPSDKGYGLKVIKSITKGDVVFASSAQGTAVHMDFKCPARGQYASLVRRRRPISL